MCHVLVIEDEWMIAEHVADIARAAGATSIDTADTQHDAVKAAQSHLPAIILSDVNLLQGTGPRAVAAIQAAYGPIPVIFITGTPEDCEPCDHSAVVLQKPLNELAITRAFRRMAPL
ncbi:MULTISPECIES: response regulator [unclassified Sphingomonas]|uniref:response regulator n=1 Tax=unclassified Sphingomonas TaxID=196159 RepID=UPI00226A744A|nr:MULTISPECIES: response regulator [unclassified Sphingomonas]